MDEIFVDIEKIHYKRILEALAKSDNASPKIGEYESLKLSSMSISKIINALSSRILDLEFEKIQIREMNLENYRSVDYENL